MTSPNPLNEKGFSDPEDLGTLEPLLEAVRAGVEGAGWALSGLQKTTSYEYEGRWAGEYTRSAYGFFHRASPEDDEVSVECFLDETSDGLKGNLTLVVPGPRLGELGPVAAALGELARLADANLLPEYRTPVVLRLSLPSAKTAPAKARTEARFRIQIPKAAIEAGGGAVTALAGAAVAAFERLLGEVGWLHA